MRHWKRKIGATVVILVGSLGLAGCLSVTPTGSVTPPDAVRVCGTRLCVGSATLTVHGSTFYNPGLTPYLSGIKNPSGTIDLANQAKINTLRITNYLDVKGPLSTAPTDETSWQRVDAIIAAARTAGMHVTISFGDYRKLLWNHCVNPYTANWGGFLSFVANRVNTSTGVAYKSDPTIAFVSIAGEPLRPGTYSFTAAATGRACTISYTTNDLTAFYRTAEQGWKLFGATVLVTSGGLTYLDLDNGNSGIDWQAIFSEPANDLCAVKTYGNMLSWVPNAASYCAALGKPIINEEFGYTQSTGDAARAALFTQQYQTMRDLGFAGWIFWNLGYEIAPTSYQVNPSTPQTFAVVQANAP